MPEVKWIKLSTQMFEDEKIRLIESLPEADTILVLWIKLLAQAGKTNATGYIYLNENIPFTDEMLATVFNRPITTVRLALKTFEQFGMIEILDNNFISICNWEKHQNVDGLEKIREQNRIRKQREREAKRLNSPITKRDGETCQYCGNPASGFDHIVPVSQGGTDDPSNKVPCCKRCNQMKMVQKLEDFLNYYQDIVKKDLVMNNSTLSRFVKFENGKWVSRDITGQVTQVHATDIDKEIDKEKNIYSNEFERFWSIYPRKVDKKKALKSFKTCLKNNDIETIIKGTEKYALQVKSTDKQYIKHPSTFLNNESFIDGFEEVQQEAAKQPVYQEGGALSGFGGFD